VKIWLEQRRQIIRIINHQEARSHHQKQRKQKAGIFLARHLKEEKSNQNPPRTEPERDWDTRPTTHERGKDPGEETCF
jgi:hypothetical protein